MFPAKEGDQWCHIPVAFDVMLNSCLCIPSTVALCNIRIYNLKRFVKWVNIFRAMWDVHFVTVCRLSLQINIKFKRDVLFIFENFLSWICFCIKKYFRVALLFDIKKPSDSRSDLQMRRPWTEFHWTFANVWTLSALSGGVTATRICTFNRFEHVYFWASVLFNWGGIGVYKLESGPDQD